MRRLKRVWRRIGDPYCDIYQAVSDSKPRCDECGRIIVVGAATNDHWQCEYCLVVESFRLT